MKHTYTIDVSKLQSADDGETTHYGGVVTVTCISNLTLLDRWREFKCWILRRPRTGAYLPWSTKYKKVECYEFAVRGTDREGIDWPMINGSTDIGDFMSDQFHDLVFQMFTGSDDVAIFRCK